MTRRWLSGVPAWVRRRVAVRPRPTSARDAGLTKRSAASPGQGIEAAPPREGYDMNGMTVAVEHGGKRYAGAIMRIRSTHLGAEDHGIFTAYLHCEGAGTGVGVGGYGLDAWSEADKRRVGTSFGMEHIAAIMRTVGVDQWEKIAGRDIVVLHDGDHIWGSRAVGIASLMGERVLIFEEHAAEWREREPKVATA